VEYELAAHGSPINASTKLVFPDPPGPTTTTSSEAKEKFKRRAKANRSLKRKLAASSDEKGSK